LVPPIDGTTAPWMEMGGEEMNWQPIKTAPKDGTLILTYSKDYRAEYSVSYWCRGDEEWQTDFRQKGAYQQVDAEYWMPLPEPPPEPTCREFEQVKKEK